MSNCNICGYYQMEADKKVQIEAVCKKCNSVFAKIDDAWIMKKQGEKIVITDPEDGVFSPS